MQIRFNENVIAVSDAGQCLGRVIPETFAARGGRVSGCDLHFGTQMPSGGVHPIALGRMRTSGPSRQADLPNVC